MFSPFGRVLFFCFLVIRFFFHFNLFFSFGKEEHRVRRLYFVERCIVDWFFSKSEMEIGYLFKGI